MANVLSDIFTNFYTTPRTLAGPQSAVAQRAGIYFSRSTVQLLNAHAANTIYPMFRVQATSRILGIWLANDALASVTDLNFGIWTAVDWSAGDGVAKDEDIYCDGISLATARSVNVSVDPSLANRAASDAVASVGSMFNVLGQVGGGGAITGLQWGRRVWEDAGDATEPRPGTEYDLCLRSVSDPAGTGNVVMGLLYTTGN